jgi:hypothetical protein
MMKIAKPTSNRQHQGTNIQSTAFGSARETGGWVWSVGYSMFFL